MSQSSVVCLVGLYILRTEELSMWSWKTAMTLVRFCACATNHLTELYSITSLLGEGKDLGKREAGKTDYLMWQKFFCFFSDIFTIIVKRGGN